MSTKARGLTLSFSPSSPSPPPRTYARRLCHLRPPPWPPAASARLPGLPPTPPASPASRRLHRLRPHPRPPAASARPSPASRPLILSPRRQNPHKRRAGGKGKPGHSKKLKRSDEPVRRSSKPSDKFLKLLQKRARDYNSDDDEPLSEEEEEVSCSEDESVAGFARFEEGCRAFRVAFSKVMAKKLPDDPLVRFSQRTRNWSLPSWPRMRETTSPGEIPARKSAWYTIAR
ncbi:hypothetical protein GUJ93_ZPchr0001g30157 [Zizania palustris]|uniref:Uncharacterized protein n=1 Tax=Zizania palustris TaxID=103762 RepID=A0A8J5RRB1_ZIZPA|nr:hypothetical protein GUJ93_ZPchr0001g30157 [Zizania palustris]